jgi:hypothetical protein
VTSSWRKLAGFYFRITRPAPTPRPGVRAASPRHSRVTSFVSLKFLGQAEEAGTTHVSSKCCSKVASIPPVVRLGPVLRCTTRPAPPQPAVTWRERGALPDGVSRGTKFIAAPRPRGLPEGMPALLVFCGEPASCASLPAARRADESPGREG